MHPILLNIYDTIHPTPRLPDISNSKATALVKLMPKTSKLQRQMEKMV